MSIGGTLKTSVTIYVEMNFKCLSFLLLDFPSYIEKLIRSRIQILKILVNIYAWNTYMC